MSLVLAESSCDRLLTRRQCAFRKVVVLATALTVGFCSIAAANPPYRNRQQTMNSVIQNNIRNDQIRKATAAQASNVIQQSETQIKKRESKLKQIKDDLPDASNQVDRLTKSLDECESKLDDAQRKRTAREKELLDAQDSSSRYQMIVQRLKEADDQASQQAARVLGHGVKHGDPDQLKLSVGKSQFKSLEDDKDCSEAFALHRKTKREKAEEVKRLLAVDGTIEKLDATISQETKERKTLKASLSAATAKKKKLINKKEVATANIAAAQKTLDAAKNYLAQSSLK